MAAGRTTVGGQDALQVGVASILGVGRLDVGRDRVREGARPMRYAVAFAAPGTYPNTELGGSFGETLPAR